jgi:hypothetical protein
MLLLTVVGVGVAVVGLLLLMVSGVVVGVVVLLLLLLIGVVVVLLLLLVLCWPPPAVLLPLGQISSSSSNTTLHCNAAIDEVCKSMLPEQLSLTGMMAGVTSHNPLASQDMDSTEDAASASAPAAGPRVPSLPLSQEYCCCNQGCCAYYCCCHCCCCLPWLG